MAVVFMVLRGHLNTMFFSPLIYVKDEDGLVGVVFLQQISRTHSRVYYM